MQGIEKVRLDRWQGRIGKNLEKVSKVVSPAQRQRSFPSTTHGKLTNES